MLLHSLRQLRLYSRSHGLRYIVSSRAFSSTPFILSNIKFDEDSLPQNPTWSIRSLLPPSDSSSSQINLSTLTHLLKLAQLNQPSEPDKLLQDLNDMDHFLRNIQEVDVTGVEPMRGVWEEGRGIDMREDMVKLDDRGECGRDLLKFAEKVEGNWYVVEREKRDKE